MFISPRSLLACDRLGVKLDEIYFMDFYEFKQKHPELYSQPEEIVKLKWDYLESLREQTLKVLREERKILLQNPLNDSYVHIKDTKK
jgi:hypothetical protein